MTVMSLPLSPSYSNWYVGVSHCRQMKYSGSLISDKNTLLRSPFEGLRLSGSDRWRDEACLARGVLDDRGVDVGVGSGAFDDDIEVVALCDQRKEALNRSMGERVWRNRHAGDRDVASGQTLQRECERRRAIAEVDDADVGAEDVAEREVVQRA